MTIPHCKKTIGQSPLRLGFLIVLAILACGTAFAQEGKMRSGPYHGPMAPMVAPDVPDAVPFFTNLEANACTGCNYSSDNGYFILGPNNCFAPGATQWLAYPFISKKTGAVTKVTLAITDYGACTPTSHRFTVAIYSDACTNTPGTQIGSAVVSQAAAAPCLLANANFGTAGVSLVAGNKYWVVVTTSAAAPQNATTAVWWMANLAQAPYNLNDGMGWIAFPDGAPGAFSVR